MRRIVRARVAASLEQAKPQLEESIAQRLQYLDGFPLVLNNPVISIRDLHRLRIMPLVKADYPPVDIDAIVSARWPRSVRNVPCDPGPLVFDIDVQLKAIGTVRSDGTYNIAPQSAKLKAWWREMGPRC